MARAAATVEPDEQAALFEELDESNPAHKELMKAARHYAKKRQERLDVFGPAKEAEDAAMETLIEQMHGQNLTAFRFEGVSVKLTTEEKIKVKIDTSDDDDDE